MRHALAATREDLEGGEDEWIIAAAGTVISSVFAGKRWINDTKEKTREDPWSKTQPSKTS
jgi:hypothetical protein